MSAEGGVAGEVEQPLQHHPDCPRRDFGGRPERCWCAPFVVFGPLREEQGAPLADFLAVARDVVADFGHHCDNHAACACSMARLARLVTSPAPTTPTATDEGATDA